MPKPRIKSSVVVIILDSGFSPEVVQKVRHLVGFWDLDSGLRLAAEADQDKLAAAQKARIVLSTSDPLNHGTIVLERLLAASLDLPVILVRCFNAGGSSIKSGFAPNGELVSAGWTEAYLWAQELCAQRGLASVANCSFGGFHHAMDGSGWESYQLSRVGGPGKAGHIVVAATGPGDGRALHASCLTQENSRARTVSAWQPALTTYNLWVDRKRESSGVRDFALVVKRDGREIFFQRGIDLPANFWNGKQQSTICVEGRGLVEFEIFSLEFRPTRFDLFISESADHDLERSHFCDHVDSELISEPAIFSHVIAVGLEAGSYGSTDKPDVLLGGFGPISFRTPEVTYALSLALAANPSLDSRSARAFLQANPH